MVNGIRASDLRGLNKGHGSKLRVASQIRQESAGEARKMKTLLSLRVFGLLSSSLLLFDNVSVDMSSGLLQVFVELGNLHGTLNYVLYWLHGVAYSDSVSLKYSCSEEWTCNLQMIVSFSSLGN